MPASGLVSLEGFKAVLEIEVRRAERFGRALTVAVLEIDRAHRRWHLRGGDPAGAAIVGAAEEAIASRIRSSDRACRMDDRRFGILFCETPVEQARLAVMRIVAELGRTEVGDAHGVDARAGLAELVGREEPDVLIARAESAAKKAADRDRVAVAEPA